MTDFILAELVKLSTGAVIRYKNESVFTGIKVYYSNHTSHLDFLVIWASLPAEIRKGTVPAAAKDYWEKGIIRRFLAKNVFHAILIDRKELKFHESPIEKLLEAVKNGNSLIIFPEGTRSFDGKIGNFKNGIYYLAKENQDLEFVPVYVDNLNQILPKGEVLPVPMLCSITFGCPIKLEKSETKEKFIEKAKKAIIDLKTGVEKT